MGIQIGKLNKRRGNGGGNNFSENIAVEFKEVKVADPKKATPAEDVLVAYLLHDAQGLVAEFDKDGNPTTEIRVKIDAKRTSNLTGEHAPLEVFDIPRKRGNHKPVKPGGVVILERCYNDERAGNFVTGWLTVATRDPAEGLETAHTGLLVTVEAERHTDVEEAGRKERRYRQTRYAVVVDKARTFGSLDEFKSNAIEFLKEEPNGGGGRPGFWVRLINLKDPTEIATTTISLSWDQDNQRMRPADEVVEAWLADPDNADWANYVAAAGTEDGEGYLFEQIPFFRYPTGSLSLPSKSTKGRDDSEGFSIPVEENGEYVRRRDNGNIVMTNGFTEGTMVVRRQEDSESAVWFATRTYPQRRFGRFFTRDELPTTNLPANIAELYSERAAKRGEFRLDAVRQQKGQGAPASQPEADSYDGDVGFGEPDPRGGLNPR